MCLKIIRKLEEYILQKRKKKCINGLYPVFGSGMKRRQSKYQQVKMSTVILVTSTSTKCRQVNISTNNNIDRYYKRRQIKII